MNGRVDECVCKRNPTAVGPGFIVEIVASSAWKTLGPVERVAQPDAPGSHHHTPCWSSGSIAIQRPKVPRPTSMGVTVTRYRGR